ncbi:hypothetical protein WL77_10500 [Burkholderia ubonensis]|uniref:anthrone oxygenase family protein n=1 Tax=Burkholderia ubonensis TaxID=101571 RepID=UPI000754C85B|nr:anthrone oxygenase family protein [Burkholderia ubonensis]KWE71117.1 hypothetical protein WL77_10500 [Burkholderia ubonensis]KWE76724.1 hypothetical protein WL79_09680 [Burkholderia ubonensis]
MRALVTLILLWFSAIGCGLMAGVYFAFSTFVMTSLGRLAPAAGVAAMNAINVDIVRSLFMPVFLGTTLASLALAILALLHRSEPGAIWIVAGGAIYVLGMFGVTMVFNVPLNDALSATDASSAEGAAFWARYLRDWTVWNHARTAASAVACGSFIAALAAR